MFASWILSEKRSRASAPFSERIGSMSDLKQVHFPMVIECVYRFAYEDKPCSDTLMSRCFFRISGVVGPGRFEHPTNRL